MLFRNGGCHNFKITVSLKFFIGTCFSLGPPIKFEFTSTKFRSTDKLSIRIFAFLNQKNIKLVIEKKQINSQACFRTQFDLLLQLQSFHTPKYSPLFAIH
jgi:hypothetical protein